MRLVGFSYRTHNTRPTFLPPLFNSTRERKALYVHIRSRAPLNYRTAAAAAAVATRIPVRLQRSDLTAAVDSPSMCDHLYDTLRCDWLVFLIEAVIKKQRSDHRDMQRFGTKNGAIPQEGACSRPANREGQGKAATEKRKAEGVDQADGGPQSKGIGRKR